MVRQLTSNTSPPVLVPTKPAPVLSRVVTLQLDVPAGVGNTIYRFTPPLGNSLILYGIRVWACCPVAAAIGGDFYFMFGAGEPQSFVEVRDQWNTIMDVYHPSIIGFLWREVDKLERRFSMARLFTKSEIRLAFAVQNVFNQGWHATVAYEISEG